MKALELKHLRLSKACFRSDEPWDGTFGCHMCHILTYIQRGFRFHVGKSEADKMPEVSEPLAISSFPTTTSTSSDNSVSAFESRVAPVALRSNRLAAAFTQYHDNDPWVPSAGGSPPCIDRSCSVSHYPPSLSSYIERNCPFCYYPSSLSS